MNFKLSIDSVESYVSTLYNIYKYLFTLLNHQKIY